MLCLPQMIDEHKHVLRSSCLCRFRPRGVELCRTGGLLKILWFTGERSRAYAYGAVGSESYRLEIAERIGSLYANTVGAGADCYWRPAVKISPSLEYQDRERGPRFLQFGFEIGVLW